MEAFFMEKKGGSDFHDSYAFFNGQTALEQERLCEEAFKGCQTQITQNIAIAWSDEGCLLIPKLARKAAKGKRY